MKYLSIYLMTAALLFCLIAPAAALFSIGDPPKTWAAPVANPSSGKPLIVVDAGHGGVDGGAVGADGTVEKTLNLSIAKFLEAECKSAGFEVIMTRTEDVSIHDDGIKTIRRQKVSDLKNRAKILEESEAKLLISIHQNKFQVEKYDGTQVFYGGNNPDSEVLAESVRKQVVNDLQPDNKRELKKSTKDIFLLYTAKKPAIMVECGFLSNRAECEKLKTEEYQKQLAKSVAKGLKAYYSAKPQGT